MTWLDYSADEVSCFHPVFQAEGDLALKDLGLEADYRWDHHPADSLGGTPDFVLRHIQSDRWIVAVELKRTRQAVWSPQFQQRAKSYAEYNQAKYRSGWPKYFVISNLEIFVLGALNGAKPPKECIIQGGVTDTGRLGDEEAAHRAEIRRAIAKIAHRTITVSTADFDDVWPGIIDVWLQSSAGFPSFPAIRLPEPATVGWDLVREYFADDLDEASRRVLLLRCLAIEYLRGTLARYDHPSASAVPPLKTGPSSVAASLTAMRGIDFDALFESDAAEMYTGLTDPVAVAALNSYITDITEAPHQVANLAFNRVDAPVLINTLLTSITPPERQQMTGKVQTDPELAAILATLTMHDATSNVVDVGCGEGSLISAAYDRLVALGGSPADIQPQLSGIEADPISLRIAAMRLALKEPRLVDAARQANLVFGDVFAHAPLIGNADVVLMNPPFKRYEAQDERPVPAALREHYADQIRSTGGPAFSLRGQSNLYSFYVEFVAACVSPGTVVGLVLDNKWYHNSYAARLRQLVLNDFEIIALVEYPYSAFFRDWMVSTSLLIARRCTEPNADHEVRFVRARVDPRSSDLNELSGAISRANPWPLDWRAKTIRQADLNADDGWKRYFVGALRHDFRDWRMPTLPDLFPRNRRGSLNKEARGLEILEFPFGATEYGPRRAPSTTGRRYVSAEDRPLTRQENNRLRELAAAIPEDFKGYAMKNSDGLRGYELTERDVTRDMTIEPPSLRAKPDMYRDVRRRRWTADHAAALAEMKGQPDVAKYLDEVDSVVNLSNALPADEQRWVVLREPFAGELIIPLKARGGHRVHINPYALDLQGRQVRLSSNFISYGGLVAVDPESGLDHRTSLELVVSFLLSSFGQLQLEAKGYNREGLLAVQKIEHVDTVKVFDPRWVAAGDREAILDAYRALPYPIPPRFSSELVERNALDRLWADQMAARFDADAEEMLAEVHELLDEFIFAREP